MNYLIFALNQEAKVYIEKLNAKKNDSYNFLELYESENNKILIIGVGVLNAIKKIARFFALNEIDKINDKVINIGLAGSNCYEIGDVFLINKINYNNFSLYPDIIGNSCFSEKELFSVDNITCDKSLSDMEGYGIYYACSDFFYLDNIYLIKVVSDNCKTDKINNKLIYNLIGKTYENVKKIIESENTKKMQFESSLLNNNKYQFTKSMRVELEKYLKYLYLNDKIKLHEIENKYENIEINNKEELKKLFNKIKGEINV